MILRFALAAAALVALGAVGAFAIGIWSPFTARYVAGVDVSRHQGAIDWTRLAGTDIRFAYVKASEGAAYVDPRFLVNWSGARRAGLKVGAYHFFTLCRPGDEQAANFIRTVPREAGALPPAVDLEQKRDCREGPTMRAPTHELKIFLDRVEARYGARPILYTTREFHDAHLSDLKGERFWLRSLLFPPNWRERDWVIWQRHNRARRDGVETPVDLNSFRGDAKALDRFASSPESLAP